MTNGVEKKFSTKPSEFAYRFPKTGRNGGGDAMMVESIAIPHFRSVLASRWFMAIGCRKSEPRHSANIQKIGIRLMPVSSHV
jgi:hypothetical protein